METQRKYYNVLELNRVLQMLKKHCQNNDAAESAMMLEPSCDVDEVETRLKKTYDAHSLMARYSSPSFSGLYNVNNPLMVAQAGASISAADLLKIARTLNCFSKLIEWHGKFNDNSSIKYLFDAIVVNKHLEEKIFTSIISEEEISDKASQTLYDIRRKLSAAQNGIREKLDKIIHSSVYSKFLREPVVTIRNDRFVVPVKLECRGSVSGLVHDTSASGNTVFIEPISVVEANNDIKVLKLKEKTEIERILMELSVEVGQHADDIISSYQSAVELCLIFAKANLAYEMKATMPKINSNGKINLKRARHPLLNKNTVVPVNIELGQNFDTLVITGPNTGGKTVTLKTFGLLTLMAECGLMIPADENSEISVFSKVFADIGDEQSIEQSLSTFSSHMVTLIDIVTNVDHSSLVLVDELGAGTDPVEGAALATAIIENLRFMGAKTVATTHYAELKAFALDTDGVENACCEFDVEKMKPTYRLLMGVPGRSNAFAISEKLGLPQSIVNSAREMVSDENNRFERVVSALETALVTAEKDREEALKIKTELNTLKNAVKEQLFETESKHKEIIEKARQKAKIIADRAEYSANSMLSEITDLRKKAEKAKDLNLIAQQAKESLNKGVKKLDKTYSDGKIKTDYKLPRPLVIGDRVLVVDIDKEGDVIALKDNNGKVTVQLEKVKIKLPESNLRLLEKKPKQKSEPKLTRNVTSRLDRTAQTSIDLRGKTADEAIFELDRFIDQTIMSGISVISVIHGKGTGVLRQAVNDFLKTNSCVKTFRLGVYGEGETGVTIVELK